VPVAAGAELGVGASVVAELSEEVVLSGVVALGVETESSRNVTASTADDAIGLASSRYAASASTGTDDTMSSADSAKAVHLAIGGFPAIADTPSLTPLSEQL
jgi:hypothetical protein